MATPFGHPVPMPARNDEPTVLNCWIPDHMPSNVIGMNPDARVQAQQYYRAANRDMEADLAALAAHPQGVVLLMPQLVVLMKPALSTEPRLWPELRHTPAGADAWYVHLLVGDLALARRLASALPPQRWLCFQRGLRNERPHLLPWTAFCKKTLTHSNIMGFSSSKNYTAATAPLPVATQTSTDMTREAAQQTNAQKKGLLSTILSNHRRKQTTTAVDSANTTLG